MIKKTLQRKSIEVMAYYADGVPTCATSFVSTDYHACQFYGTSHMGNKEVCMIENIALERANGGNGYLIPCDRCIVHGAKDI